MGNYTELYNNYLKAKELNKQIRKEQTKKANEKKYKKYQESIDITLTNHAKEKILERTGLNPNICITDIKKNSKLCFESIEDKNMCLVIGELANYIVSKEGYCITVLSYGMCTSGFNMRPVNKGKFFGRLIVETEKVFKRSKII